MPMTKKAWNADLKDEHTEMVYVNVPGDKKMNTKSPIDMDPGAVIGGRLEMATTKYIDGDDHEKERSTSQRQHLKESDQQIYVMEDAVQGFARPGHASRGENMLDLVSADFISHRRSAPETIMDIRSLEH